MLLDHSMKNHRLWIHDHLNNEKIIEVNQCFSDNDQNRHHDDNNNNNKNKNKNSEI